MLYVGHCMSVKSQAGQVDRQSWRLKLWTRQCPCDTLTRGLVKLLRACIQETIWLRMEVQGKTSN